MLEFKVKTEYILALFGICFLMATSILFYYIWLQAYFSGSMQVPLHINRHGEANPEFIVIPITLIFGFWAIKYLFVHPEYKEKMEEGNDKRNA